SPITKLDKKTITARLATRHNPEPIYSWEDSDPGQAVYDPQKGDYILKFGQRKIFHLTNDKYQKQKP
ncbi:33746_t:CDS:1, partial [Gigaspora margarita]